MKTLRAVPAIPQQRRREEVTHPAWCDPRLCSVDSANVSHAGRPVSWLAAASDTLITVGLAQLDEILAFDAGRQVPATPAVEIRLVDTESVRVADHAGQEFLIAADAHLDAADCRRLARQLLELAERLDTIGRVA